MKEINTNGKNIKVILENNKVIKTKYRTTIQEILEQVYTEKELKNIYALRVNNELKTYNSELFNDCKIETVGYNNYDGARIYSRTVKFLLYMAMKRLYPKLEIDLCNTIDNNIYFIAKNSTFTNDMAVEILKEMRAIVARDSKIVRKVVTYEEAVALFKMAGNTNKIDSLNIKLASYVTLYFSEDMYGSMFGILAPSAGYVSDFDIKVFREGFVLICPLVEDRNKLSSKVKENRLYDIYEQNSKFLESIGIKEVSTLNEKVISGNIADIIKVSEALHSNKMAELVSQLSTRKSTKMILIAGPSSSGKTTFAHKLGVNIRLIGLNPVTVSMDNYFKEREDTPKLPNGEYDFETIDALDLDLFNKHMEMLFAGKKIELPTFDFHNGKKKYKSGNFLQLKDNDIVILEGIHALNPLISKSVEPSEKFSIYIAPMTTLNMDDFSKVSTTDTRILRRMVRDFHTRGHNVETTLKMWGNIMKGEDNYIYPFVKNADYIYNTSLVYEIGVIKTFAEPLLLQVQRDSVHFSEARRLYNFLKNFLAVETKDIPNDSILREFIGTANFNL